MTDPAPSDRAETDWYWREVIVPRVSAARAEREHVLVGREGLVSRVEALLFYEDPIGINFDTNTDEYRPEARTIVVRFPEATSPDDVQRIIHEEFVRWFDRQIEPPPAGKTGKAVWWSPNLKAVIEFSWSSQHLLAITRGDYARESHQGILEVTLQPGAAAHFDPRYLPVPWQRQQPHRRGQDRDHAPG